MRQRVPLALRTRSEQHGSSRGGLAEAEGRHVGLDELHRVVDREQRSDVATGRVDVEVDVLVGVLRLQEQHLRTHQVRNRVIDWGAEEDDALLQQARVEVVGALASTR